MNDFVNYLNSTNNAGGNSTGSLAEKQVKSSYYDAVKVDRNLGKYIARCITNGEHRAFILTGHAGDGKTSILVQVLKALKKLQPGEGLKVEKEYDDFLYVKDMSEIAAGSQAATLRKMLLAPETGKTSLLISNTGPLLKAFNQVVAEDRAQKGIAYSSDDRNKLQSKLLCQLDENKDDIFQIEGYSLMLVNIARVDNVSFASKILKNMIAPELWTECSNCSCVSRCPIKRNQELVTKQFDRVAAFVENYYRYLYEHDKRMTIRQMVGQISYALTGNYTCSDIAKRSLREPFFNYNFANLFFGYRGLKPAKDAGQIKAVHQIRNLALDRIALNVDYQLFVKQDFSCFVPEIKTLIEDMLTKSCKHYRITGEDQQGSEKSNETEMNNRCAIRRFYLMFSLVEDEEGINSILNQIYGSCYTDYRKLITSKQGKHKLNEMRNMIFDALYLKNTGFLGKGINTLPLTLRREDDVFQSVMIVLGEAERSRLSVIQKSAASTFEDIDEKQKPFLKLSGERTLEFPLSLPLVTYFTNLIEGAISYSNNPALTHGIAQLDTKLLEAFQESDVETGDGTELKVVINTSNGQIVETFTFEGTYLSID